MASNLTPEKTILSRIQREEQFTALREKVGGLRRVIGGDMSQLNFAMPGYGMEESNPAANADAEENASYRSHELVDQYKVGTSNDAAVTIRTLVGQTSMRFPSIETDDLEPNHAAFHQKYLKTICAPAPVGCNAQAQMKQALVDYLIGGYAFTVAGPQAGVPCVQWVDLCDVIWPHETPIGTQFPWVAYRKRLPLYEWGRIYGKDVMAPVLRALRTAGSGRRGDKELMQATVVMICYYDRFGEQGTHALYDPSEQKVILVEPSMYVATINGKEVPYTPVDMSAAMHVPGVLMPTTIAELILPIQAGLTDIQIAINRYARRHPFFDVEDGAYEPSVIKAIVDGEDMPVAVRSPGSQPAQALGYVDMPNALLQANEMYGQKLTTLGGASPYASGGIVDGIQYAAEVNAIQQQGALVASMVSADHASHWAQVVRTMLLIGQRYHVAPFTMRLDDIEFEFDAANPVSAYLAPDADFVVREETLSASAAQLNLQKALTVMQTTIQAVSTGAVPPNAVTAAYTDVLQAANVRDIKRFLEPTPGMAMGASAPETQSTEGSQ